MRRRLVLSVCALALFLLGYKCLPDADINLTVSGNLESSCADLLNANPPSFAFEPGTSSKRVWAVDGTSRLVGFDVDVVPPVLLPGFPDDPANPGPFIIEPPYTYDGRGPQGTAPLLEEISFLTHTAFASSPGGLPSTAVSVGLLTASGDDMVLFFDPTSLVGTPTGRLFTVSATRDSKPDYMKLPAQIRPRTGIATLTCVHPPVDTPNSLLEIEYDSGTEKCGSEASSFFARGLTGAALTDGPVVDGPVVVDHDYLFVSTSNFAGVSGGADVYFPGTVIAYKVDQTVTPALITPEKKILTYGFNPTHLDAVDVDGVVDVVNGKKSADFILVTVSGVDETEPVPIDDDVYAEDVGQRQAAIEVIDAVTLELVARYPLGAANLAPTGLAISPTELIAVAGSRAGALLMVVDLAPLVDFVPGEPGEPPLDLSAYVIHDFAKPFRVSQRKNGADEDKFPGEIAGVAINAAEDRFYVTDRHDGTVVSIPLHLVAGGGSTGQTLYTFASPIDTTEDDALTGPASIAVRPGVDPTDYDANVLFLIGEPGNLCAVDI